MSTKLFIAKENGKLGSSSIPDIGENRPKGWELEEELFVDNSGWGREGEPALTLDQFTRKIKAGYGYATIGHGQFQVWVGVFKKIA